MTNCNTNVGKYLTTKAKAVNYKEFLDIVEGLIKDGEIELKKNWLEQRTLFKFKNTEFKDINYVVLRKEFCKTYNLLVGRDDFRQVIEAISESNTTEEESDEWIYIAREWLKESNTNEITTKDLGKKCFSLSVRDLNPKTLQRLAKVLRCNGFTQNTKTRKWSNSNSSATVLPNDLQATDINTSKVAVSQCYSMLPTATKSYKEEFETFKHLYHKEKQKVKELTETINNLQSQLDEYRKSEVIEEVKIKCATPWDD